MSQTERRLGLFLGTLIAVCSIALFSLALRPVPLVFDNPLTEDAYYTLTVARNIARGVGFSVDGHTLTNGFQPLWAIVTAPIFMLAGSSNEAAMRMVLVLIAAMIVLSAVSWSAIAGGVFGVRTRLYRLAFVLIYVTSFPLLTQHFNGLETGLFLLALGSTGSFWCAPVKQTLGRSAIMGLLLGLVVLARNDAGIFAVLLALETLWSGRRDLGRTVARVAAMTAAAAIVAGPWFVYNIVLTGNPVPISGVSLSISLDRMGALGMIPNAIGAIARDAFPSVLAEVNRPLALTAAAAAVAAAVFLARRSGVSPGDANDAIFLRRCRLYAAMVAGYLAIQISIYTFVNAAAFFYTRYFILLSILSAGVFGYLLYRLVTSRAAWLGAPVALVLAAGGLLATAGWYGVPFAARINAFRAYPNGPTLDQVEMAQRIRIGNEKIGAIQTGTLAFFVEGAINLDGRVNPAAYRARRENRLLEYVLDQDIRLLVDYNFYLTPSGYAFFDKDPRGYFQQVAPAHPVTGYDLVGLRRTSGAGAR